MMKRNNSVSALILILLISISFGCQNDFSGKDPELVKLISSMTIEEKVGQMTQITLDVITKGSNRYSSFEPIELDTAILREALINYKVGSVLNTANNKALSPEKWYSIITEIQTVATTKTRMKIPVIYGIDAIHGATYTAGSTLFPQEIGMAATFDPELVKQAAEVTAYETRASGIPWTFSPVLDLGIDSRWPRQWETFGEDPYLASVMGVAMIKGYEGNSSFIDTIHVASCLKHFLGYGVPVSGKDRTPAFIPEYELRDKHLPAFKAAIKAGAHSIMINSGIINGVPVHANKKILTDLLKKELGFKGLVVTDWNDIENLHKRDKVATNIKGAVKMAVNAGIDMSMVPYNYEEFCTILTELVSEGAVSEDRINDAVYRVLWLKKQTGLFETPVTNPADYPDFGSKTHEELAQKVAESSITLLKNRNKILPLTGNENILVCGPNANSMRTLNGGWSYSWQGEKTEQFAQKYNTILEAVQKNWKGKVLYTPGVEYNFNGKYYEEKKPDIEAAVQMAGQADMILLCLGENSYTEKPGDLSDLTISENQQKLALAIASTGKPVILVLNEGRPRLITPFADKMDAILNIYLPGNFGGDALVNVLTGRKNPEGKLPYTYPSFPNSLANYMHKPSENSEKQEGMYDYGGSFNPLFEFGSGLSYSSFEYMDLKTDQTTVTGSDTITIEVTLKNSSTIPGNEVILIYISDLYASVTPDSKRLKAFKKVHLDANETKTVRFRLSPESFSFINGHNERVIEKGDFVIRVNELSQTIYAEQDFRISN